MFFLHWNERERYFACHPMYGGALRWKLSDPEYCWLAALISADDYARGVDCCVVDDDDLGE